MAKEQVENGYMVNNMDEVKELGKQMEQIREQQGDTRESEPIQFGKEEAKN